MEAACYTNLGISYSNLGQFRKAILCHETSLKVAKEIGNRSGELKCYGNLANTYSSLGDLQKAVEYCQVSLDIAKKIGNKFGELRAYVNIGIVYRDFGNFRKALEYYERALSISKEIEDESGESTCYANIGTAYVCLGHYRKAIEYLEKSLQIEKEIGDRSGESKCYGNLGVVSCELGDLIRAIQYHEKSLEISESIGDRVGKSTSYTNLANAYFRLNQTSKAVKYFEKSLAIKRETGDILGESKCYAGLGAAFGRLNDFKKSIGCLEKSLKIVMEAGDRTGESICYGNLGLVYYGLGDFDRALKYLGKSLKISKETENVNDERIINLNICRIYRKLNPQLAYYYCKRSVELFETISGRLVGEDHKISYISQVSGAYDCIVPLSLELGNKKEAFEYVERSKSKAFLELLAASDIKPGSKLAGKLKPLLESEEKCLAELRRIQLQHLKKFKTHVELGKVEEIQTNLSNIYDKLEVLDPEYVFIRKGKPLDVDKIQNMLAEQEKKSVIVEYFPLESEMLIFVVSSEETGLNVIRVPVPKEEIDAHFERYWGEIVEFPKSRCVDNSWLDLSYYLIEPISDYLCKSDLVYFVPYGLLHYAPIHALRLKGVPLIEKLPVAYSPSASLIKFCQSKGSGSLKTCISFGAEFEEEAKIVAEIFNSESFLGRFASKEQVRQGGVDKDIVHFSAHGYFDIIDPLSSGVRLHDGILTAREIFDMKITAELVTLSACQTGLNKRNPGDELIGLTRAFMYAGSPSVVVSLWSVSASSTLELMRWFYTFLRNGSDKATALQEAQKRVKSIREYSHPYYWAPFVLIGDWK